MLSALLLQWAVAACGTAALPAPSTALAPTLEPAQSLLTAPTPQASAPAPGTASGPARPTGSPARAEVVLRWAAGARISDTYHVSDIVTRLQNAPGIEGGFGDEVELTILYDPQQTNVDKIRRLLLDMGFPTNSP